MSSLFASCQKSGGIKILKLSYRGFLQNCLTFSSARLYWSCFSKCFSCSKWRINDGRITEDKLTEWMQTRSLLKQKSDKVTHVSLLLPDKVLQLRYRHLLMLDIHACCSRTVIYLTLLWLSWELFVREILLFYPLKVYYSCPRSINKPRMIYELCSPSIGTLLSVVTSNLYPRFNRWIKI